MDTSKFTLFLENRIIYHINRSTAWNCSIFLPEIGYALGVSTSGLRDKLNYDFSIMDTIKLNTFGSLIYLLAFLYLDQVSNP